MKVYPSNYNISTIISSKTNNFDSNHLRCKPAVNITSKKILNYDPYFGMKNCDLSPFDLACARKFKYLIEPFNTKENFLNWVEQNLRKKTNLNSYKNESEMVQSGIRNLLGDWKNHLNTASYYKNNPSLSLVIFDSITKDISANSHSYPPVLCKKVLIKTVKQLENMLRKNPKENFNFGKMYQQNLCSEYSKVVFETVRDSNGLEKGLWVKIHSKEHSSKNFNENVKKLQALSYKNWCTRVLDGAQKYLNMGDFYVYLENNKPKTLISFSDDEIFSIEGKKNNRRIPLDYIDILNSFINKNKFKGFETEIRNAEEAVLQIKDIHQKFSQDFKNKQYTNILKYLGFEVNVLEDHMIELTSFMQPKYFTFEELGIDENELFKKIKIIANDADFSKSKVTDLGTLQSIGRNAFFDNISRISGNVANIGGYVCSGGKIRDKNDLQFLKAS